MGSKTNVNGGGQKTLIGQDLNGFSLEFINYLEIYLNQLAINWVIENGE